MKSGSKAAAAEEEKTIMELIAAHLDITMAWEVSSTPLKFHDQISALWEYDKTVEQLQHFPSLSSIRFETKQ